MVHLIDALHLGTPDVICIALVECGPKELLLVDSGPESVFDTVADGVRKLGFRPDDVRHLLASHVHLDHTGGNMALKEEFGAKVVGPKKDAGRIPPRAALKRSFLSFALW